MRALYRTSFEIRSALSCELLFQKVADLCWLWIFDPVNRGKYYGQNKPFGAVAISIVGLPKGHSVDSLACEYEGERAWGVLFRHIDSDDDNLSWDTELSIYRTAKGKTFFACSTLLGRNDGAFTPSYRKPARPRIVRDVLQQFGGFGAFKLVGKPLLVSGSPDKISELGRFLELTERSHPVVFVSMHEQSKSHIVNFEKLSDLLGGLAHVVVAKDIEANRLLNQWLPFRLACFAGAIRIYWPGFKRSAPGSRHPLWTTERILELETRRSGQIAETILGEIAEVTVFNIHENFFTWARLQELDRKRAISTAISANKQVELLRLYEEDNTSLINRLRDMQNTLATSAEEIHRCRSLAETYRIALEGRKNNADISAGDSLSPSSVREAVERAQRKYADRLVFALNSKSEERDSSFRFPDQVFDVLDWLASFYFEARAGRQRCPRLDNELAEILPGWGYSAHQSEVSKGTNPEWYQCTWDGRRYEIEEHVGYGTSRRPEEAIRIAFAWDSIRERIVIGYIGQHQKSTKS
jgi:hypothetical protein